MFKCLKCNSINTFIKKNGTQTGLYCGSCGSWIKWLNKKEVTLFEHYNTNNKQKFSRLEVAEAINSLKNCEDYVAVNQVLDMFKNME